MRKLLATADVCIPLAAIVGGATTYLVRTGYGTETEKSLGFGKIFPDYIADDLYQA